MAGEEAQLDWASGPLTTTGLSGCSRAAFRGLMELKKTPDRQPLNPREAKPASSSSISPDSEHRERNTERREDTFVISKFQLHI